MKHPVSVYLSDPAALMISGMRTLRCPEPGCPVRIRYRAVEPGEEEQLK